MYCSDGMNKKWNEMWKSIRYIEHVHDTNKKKAMDLGYEALKVIWWLVSEAYFAVPSRILQVALAKITKY
jgi:hypothetical protein